MFRIVVLSLAAVAVVISLALSVHTYLSVTQLRAEWAKAMSPEGINEPPLKSSNKVVALGRLEPLGGVIDLSGLPGDRLESLGAKVKVGEKVYKDDELARLESYDLRLAELKYAETALEEAKVRKNAEQAYADTLIVEAELGVKQAELLDNDLVAQKARIKVLEANKAVAHTNHQRLERLQKSNGSIVSPYKLEQQQLLVKQADAELAAAQAQLAKLEATVKFSQDQARGKLKAAHAADARQKAASQLGALEGKVDLAKKQLALTTIRARAAGRVLKIFVQPGETLGQLPILRIGRVDQMYAVAEVYETDVTRVKPGQGAEITSPALSKPLTGTVELVGVTVGKNEMLSIDPTRRADLRVVEVWIKLDESSEAAELIDLQVRVEIDTPPRKADAGAASQASAAQAPRHER